MEAWTLLPDSPRMGSAWSVSKSEVAFLSLKQGPPGMLTTVHIMGRS